MEKIIKKEKLYTDGMLFEVKITSRYLTIMGNRAFEKLNLNMNFEEYIILDTISYNDGICHSDLAKILLRDKSNTGKIVSGLEKCGYVNIKPDIRNNRIIKKIFITDEGIKICNDIYVKLLPYIQMLYMNLTEEEQQLTVSCLQKFRTALKQTVDTKI